MADNNNSHNTPTANPAPVVVKRPQAPPYRPDMELIGYMEKGQKPATPAPRTAEKR